jgi:hypothetical protein
MGRQRLVTEKKNKKLKKKKLGKDLSKKKSKKHNAHFHPLFPRDRRGKLITTN